MSVRPPSRLACVIFLLASLAFPQIASPITGGTPIQVQSAPWAAFVQNQASTGRFLCSGTIIDATHIVTAAHCLYDNRGQLSQPTSLSIRAGASNFTAPLDTDVEQDRGVRSFRAHPGYVWTRNSSPDDVAILKLSAPLDLDGPAVEAAPLPSAGQPYPAGATVGLAGFGRQSPTASASGPLAWMETVVDQQGTCGGPSSVGAIDADAVVLCASSTTTAACNGDSGGGLVTLDTHVLIGVVSAGPPSCGAGTHTLFTYVSAPEIASFIAGNDEPPAAPRETARTVIDLRWTPPLVVGTSLSCTSEQWTGNPELSYAFIVTSSGRVAQSGTKSVYLLSKADVGSTFLCQVTAVNAGGSAVDWTGATSEVKPAPQVVIRQVEALTVVPGRSAVMQVTLKAPNGLPGKVGVCITMPTSIGGRVCASQRNDEGAGGLFGFTLTLHIKAGAPVGVAAASISAAAGVSRATTRAVLRVTPRATH